MSILVEYIFNLYPPQEFVNNDVPIRLQQCLSSFANKQISLNEAKSIIQSLNLTIEPLEKLNRILNINPAPITSRFSSFKQSSRSKRKIDQNPSLSIDSGSHDLSDSASSDNDTLKDTEIIEEIENENSDEKLISKEENDSISNRRKSHCWTPSEDERLLAGVHRYGIDNWSSVALFVGNSRTRSQCSQRWSRGIDPRLSKNLWTHEEETMLIQLVTVYGNKSWTQIANKLGNRSDVQCRYHYKQIHREFQSHANAAAHFLNNNSQHLQNLFQNQNSQIQDQQSSIQNLNQSQLQQPKAPFQIQSQQPQFQTTLQPQQLQFQVQSQHSQFQPPNQNYSIINNMYIKQMNQANNLNNYNTLNVSTNYFPSNQFLPQTLNNPMTNNYISNISSIQKTFQPQNRNSCFIPQQHSQNNMINWQSNKSIPQQTIPTFSNFQQFYQYGQQFSNINTNLRANSEYTQKMQIIQNQEKEHIQSTPNTLNTSNTSNIPSAKQNQDISNHNISTNLKLKDNNNDKTQSLDLPQKQSLTSSSSSGSEPAIFELDDSDLFSKEAMTFFSVPNGNDFLFF